MGMWITCGWVLDRWILDGDGAVNNLWSVWEMTNAQEEKGDDHGIKRGVRLRFLPDANAGNWAS